MLKRNLDNLKKFLTLRAETQSEPGLTVYSFDNEDQNIRADLLVDRAIKSIEDMQHPFICHTWNEQWAINVRMANSDVTFVISLVLNQFNKIDTVYIFEHLWHYTPNTDQIS